MLSSTENLSSIDVFLQSAEQHVRSGRIGVVLLIT